MSALRQLFRLSRRRFLASSALFAVPGAWAAAGPKLDTETERAVLAAFVDALIPADEQTPSASSLGIDDDLLADNPDGPVRSLIGSGCAWLQQSASPPLLEMKPGMRVKLLEWMEASPEGQLPHIFFDYMRDQAMRRYYARPEAWSGLGIERPPQPVGYTDLVKAGDA